jgi:hypothetical protein
VARKLSDPYVYICPKCNTKFEYWPDFYERAARDKCSRKCQTCNVLMKLVTDIEENNRKYFEKQNDEQIENNSLEDIN